MNGKHGVLEVIDAEIACLPIMAEMMTGHDGDAFDAKEAVRRMAEARATVERLADAASSLAEDYCRMVEGERSDDPRSHPGYPEYKAFCSALRAFNGEQS